MATLIHSPSIIQAAGNKPKVIEEFVGRVNSQTSEVNYPRVNLLGLLFHVVETGVSTRTHIRRVDNHPITKGS